MFQLRSRLISFFNHPNDNTVVLSKGMIVIDGWSYYSCCCWFGANSINNSSTWQYYFCRSVFVSCSIEELLTPIMLFFGVWGTSSREICHTSFAVGWVVEILNQSTTLMDHRALYPPTKTWGYMDDLPLDDDKNNDDGIFFFSFVPPLLIGWWKKIWQLLFWLSYKIVNRRQSWWFFFRTLQSTFDFPKML